MRTGYRRRTIEGMDPHPSRTLGAALASCLLVLAMSGCGQDEDKPARSDDAASSSESPAASASTSPGGQAPIVGEWQRTQSCDELVGLLRKAGLEQAIAPMLAEDGWIPGVTKPSQIEDPSHPCEHAVSRKHSHFFPADGQFGSRDAAGEQVDDGSYELVGDDRVVFGGVTFTYVINDDTIMFTPVVPDCAPDCFEASWSVSVAYEGYSWKRIG